MVDDREPRYRLVDADGETVLASFYEREDGSIAIEHSSGEAITIDAEGLTTGNLDADSATIEEKASPYATESEVNEKADDPHDNTAHSETYATTTEVDEKADDPHGDAAHSEDYAKSDDNVEGFSTSGEEGTVPTSQGDGTLAMLTVDDGEVSVSDDGTLVVSAVEGLNHASNLTVTDDGDNTVTIDATDTDTRIDVSDDGELILSEPTDVNFAENISVVDDGDGTVSVTSINTDTIPSASDNDEEVVAEVLDFNFGANLNVTSNDTNDEVTVDADTGGTTDGASLTTSRRYGLLGGS